MFSPQHGLATYTVSTASYSYALVDPMSVFATHITGIFSTWRAAGITWYHAPRGETDQCDCGYKRRDALLSGGILRDVFTLNWTGLSGLLTIFGGLNPATGSLWLTDVAHHHLAVAVTFLVAGHLYRTQFSALWMPSSTDTGPWMYPRTNCPKVAGQLKLQFVNTWYRHA